MMRPIRWLLPHPFLTLLLTVLAFAFALLALVALPTSLPAVAALIVLIFARTRAGIELFLQIAERLITQPLLIAQRFGQAFHRLLTRRLATLTLLALCDLHVLHHFLQLAQRLFGFGHAALLHQLLNAVHHALQIILRHLHGIALLALLLRVAVLFLLLCLLAL